MLKKCSSCEVEKDKDEFYVDRSRKGGLSRLCKECEKFRCNQRYLYKKMGFNFSMAKGLRITKTPLEKFWEKVDKRGEDECWEWTGTLQSKGNPGCPYGYGCFYHDGKSIRAHRFSYELHNGTIDPDLVICHSCDNTLCVNPNHLWQGTRLDNLIDMWKKGRGKTPRGATVIYSDIPPNAVSKLRNP